MQRDEVDPKGLVRESYRIEGITPAQCRSIFMDWVLSLPEGTDQRGAIRRVLERHGAPQDHPMTAVLMEGLSAPAKARRRGGASGRRGGRG